MTQKKYGTTFALSIFASVLLLISLGFFSVDGLHDRLRILADSTLIPAVVLISLYLFIKIAGTGFFDILTYGFSRLSPTLNPKSTNESYYDYKTRKSKRSKINCSFFLHIGLIFALLSAVFTMAYYL